MTEKFKDIIHIQNLETTTRIGIYPHEKHANQPLIINLKIYTDINKAAQYDDISYTINYASISEFIINYVSTSNFDLIETLAETLARILIEEFHIEKVDIEILKPMALKKISNNALVSIKISRARKQN